LLADAVFAEHADGRDVIDKLAQVARDIGSAPREERFSGDFHDGHRRLRRDAGDFSPDKFVQHQIADNQDPFGRRAVENLLQPF